MSRWPSVPLGDVLHRANEISNVDPESEYHEVTIKLWGKGVISRGKVRGSEVGTTRRFVRAHQLILSKIDARNGAIGLVPPELDGAIVSNDFPSFCVDADRVNPAFLGWLVRSTQFVDLCKASSEGTTNRVRIKEDRFLAQRIALPPLAEQQAIISRLDTLADKTRQVAENLNAIEADAERLQIASATRLDLSEQQRRARGWRETTIGDIADVVLNPVAVDIAQSYPNVGIYSFARGLFNKPPIDGATTSARTLYKIKAGQFIYSRLFAFEGAYALVPSNLDGCFVSNEFPTFEIDPRNATPEFLMSLFLSKRDWERVAMGSRGLGDRRQRVQPSQILQRKIWLPPIEEQQRISKLYWKRVELRTKHAKIRESNQAIIPATLERVFLPGGNHDA